MLYSDKNDSGETRGCTGLLTELIMWQSEQARKPFYVFRPINHTIKFVLMAVFDVGEMAHCQYSIPKEDITSTCWQAWEVWISVVYLHVQSIIYVCSPVFAQCKSSKLNIYD